MTRIDVQAEWDGYTLDNPPPGWTRIYLEGTVPPFPPDPHDVDADGRFINILDTDDAAVWAREWCRIARDIIAANDGRDVTDEGWMIGWFANAIETGRRFHPAQVAADKAAVAAAIAAA